MSLEENKWVVARFVEVCQNQHDVAAADAMFHPEMVDHSFPEGRSLPEFLGQYQSDQDHAPAPPQPSEGFKRFYGQFLAAFPDATMQIEEQIAERDLVVTRKTFRGTHLGELWGLTPTGNQVRAEFIDIFRIRDGLLAEHWFQFDFEALRSQMRSQQRDAGGSQTEDVS